MYMDDLAALSIETPAPLTMKRHADGAAAAEPERPRLRASRSSILMSSLCQLRAPRVVMDLVARALTSAPLRQHHGPHLDMIELFAGVPCVEPLAHEHVL